MSAHLCRSVVYRYGYNRACCATTECLWGMQGQNFTSNNSLSSLLLTLPHLGEKMPWRENAKPCSLPFGMKWSEENQADTSYLLTQTTITGGKASEIGTWEKDIFKCTCSDFLKFMEGEWEHPTAGQQGTSLHTGKYFWHVASSISHHWPVR